jgi:hypothetical protein
MAASSARTPRPTPQFLSKAHAPAEDNKFAARGTDNNKITGKELRFCVYIYWLSRESSSQASKHNPKMQAGPCPLARPTIREAVPRLVRSFRDAAGIHTSSLER